MQALEGLRVLDLSRLLPGPFTTWLLADFGAEVIKVEEPGYGDYCRWFEPQVGNASAMFQLLNRNKKSITLNLKVEEGKEVFRELVKGADVVLESYRPGVMERLGLGYAALKKVNPRLIYCALTGYGQDGPYAQMVGHDLNYLATSGVLSLIARPGEAPVIPGLQIADLTGGMQAAIGLLLALQARERTGAGQFIDTSMLDGLLSLLFIPAAAAFAQNREPSPSEKLTDLPCYNVYQTKDGSYVTLGAVEEKFWQRFCQLVGREDLLPYQNATGEDGRWATQEVARIFAQKTSSEWMDTLGKEDICFGRVNSLLQAFEDPQVLARQMVVEFADMKQLGNPIKLSATPALLKSAAPDLGADTNEILTALGKNEQEIAALREKKAI